jgi:hypothetical protein
MHDTAARLVERVLPAPGYYSCLLIRMWLVGRWGSNPDTLRIRGDLRRPGRNLDVGILLLANDLA